MVLVVENGLAEAQAVLQELRVKETLVVQDLEIHTVMVAAVVELVLLALMVVIQLIVQAKVQEVQEQLLQLQAHQLQEPVEVAEVLGILLENIQEAVVALVVVDKAGVIKQTDIQLMRKEMV